MLDKMILGRYVPHDSFVHRLDPRMKLVFVFILMIIVFFANNIITYAVLAAVILLAMYYARLSPIFLYNGLKPIFFLLLFTFFMHVFLTKGGGVLLQLGFITIEKNGIIQGIYISLRFIMIVLISTILTLTTSPISLTDAIESLLNPLKKIKLPVHELAMMMSIALRFIPTLMDETTKVMRAQMSRGSDLSSGPVLSRFKAVVPLFIPLFVSAFKRAEDLAIAMEVRGYRGDVGRTKYRKLDWRTTDTLTLFLLIPIAALIMYFRN